MCNPNFCKLWGASWSSLLARPKGRFDRGGRGKVAIVSQGFEHTGPDTCISKDSKSDTCHEGQLVEVGDVGVHVYAVHIRRPCMLAK